MKFAHNSRAITVKNVRKMMCNNPNLDRVKVHAFTTFGNIISFCSQDIVLKRDFDIIHLP